MGSFELKKLKDKIEGLAVDQSHKITVPNHVKEVIILDDDDAVTSAKEVGAVFQYVNLPQEQKWADNKSAKAAAFGKKLTIDRLCTQLRVKVIFENPGVEKFTLELVPWKGNIEYSGAEKDRCSLYFAARPEEPITLQTEPNGEKICELDVAVPPATKNMYLIRVTDEAGNQKVSNVVHTARMVFLQVVQMESDLVKPKFQLSRVLNQLLEDSGTIMGLVSKSGAQTDRVKYERFDSRSREHLKLISRIYKETARRDLEPFLLFVLVTDDLPISYVIEKKLQFKLPAGPDDLKGFICSVPDKKGENHLLPLWPYDEDRVVEAYIDGDPLSADYFSRQSENFLAVDTKRLAADFPGKKKCTIEARFKAKIGSSAGYTYINNNIIVIGTSDMSGDAQTATISHEIGHALDLVPGGMMDFSDLDPSPTLYERRGHNGPHCHAGVPLMDDFWDMEDEDYAKVKCTMFGKAVGRWLPFCEECVKALRKIAIFGWRSIDGGEEKIREKS